MFLIAKSASAATAVLGFAGYLLHTLGYSQAHRVPVGLGAVAIFTLIVLGGIRPSNLANIAIVSVTLLALLFFVVAGALAIEGANFTPFFGIEPGAEVALGALFHASALMFVAYTGYGRIATLGEEMHDPERTIPKTIIMNLAALKLRREQRLYPPLGSGAWAGRVPLSGVLGRKGDLAYRPGFDVCGPSMAWGCAAMGKGGIANTLTLHS